MFINEETAKSKAALTRKSEKWIMYPVYIGRRIARITIGVISLETKPEWVVAALLKDTKYEKHVIQANKTQLVKLVGL